MMVLGRAQHEQTARFSLPKSLRIKSLCQVSHLRGNAPWVHPRNVYLEWIKHGWLGGRVYLPLEFQGRVYFPLESALPCDCFTTEGCASDICLNGSKPKNIWRLLVLPLGALNSRLEIWLCCWRDHLPPRGEKDQFIPGKSLNGFSLTPSSLQLGKRSATKTCHMWVWLWGGYKMEGNQGDCQWGRKDACDVCGQCFLTPLGKVRQSACPHLPEPPGSVSFPASARGPGYPHSQGLWHTFYPEGRGQIHLLFPT